MKLKPVTMAPGSSQAGRLPANMLLKVLQQNTIISTYLIRMLQENYADVSNKKRVTETPGIAASAL